MKKQPHEETPRKAQPEYVSFMLRLWREGEREPWRASLETPGTHESQKFPSLEDLIAYLKMRTGETGRLTVERPGETPIPAESQG